MKRRDVRICIIRVGGTNCDRETAGALRRLGVQAETLHLNLLVKSRSLLDYDGLIIPGGFSFGDYVRAGAILAKSLTARLGEDLKAFIDEGKPILGICNGFQVLVESGLLPGFMGITKYPEAALATNVPIGYRCRWVYLRHENQGRCIFTKDIPEGKVLRIPVAHAEGRFIFPKEKEERLLERLLGNDQLVLRYCDEGGRPAEGRYPENPNGSFYDIAGICDPSGTIFGLMPHPERAFYGWQLPDWTRMENPPRFADGRLIFSSMIEYITRRF
ncbi:MAG: phosphoribosylformylglycinamidine synthase I [Candidatus Bathyarchaeota archaeon B63]|nr:MAG: phosphoribosylformylglycinamidine synthase I [Candidatus Bathyarchaeota archaeon B63]